MIFPNRKIFQVSNPQEIRAQIEVIGYEIHIQWQEPFQKCQQAFRFDVFRCAVLHLSQQRFDKRLKRGKFIYQAPN